MVHELVRYMKSMYMHGEKIKEIAKFVTSKLHILCKDTVFYS